MALTALLTALLVAAYFALLVWGLRQRAQVVQGPWLFFFRAFFPNWKFFHAVGQAPRLYVRGQTAAGDWTAWQLLYPRLPRRWRHVLHNPAVNLALSHQNLVDHLAQDVHDLPEQGDVQALVSYQLVCRLAQQAVQGGCWGSAPMLPMLPLRPHTANEPPLLACQFELRLQAPGQPDAAQALLISPRLLLAA